MASGPITSWQIDAETMEIVRNFIFLGSKITGESNCSYEIKRHLLLERKAMTNLDSILKSRDITLLTKVHLVKAIVFPVIMYGCVSWTIKKAEHQRIDAFELWCRRRLLNCKEIKPVNSKGNQSWIFFGRTDADAETPIFGHLMKRTDSLEDWCWERLKAGRKGDDRGWDGWTASPTQWTWVWVSSSSWCWTGRPGVLPPWGCKESDPTEQLNWTFKHSSHPIIKDKHSLTFA